MIADEVAAVQALPTPRLVQVLGHLGIATSSWYRPSLDEKQRKRPGPAPKKIPGEVVEAVVKMATDNPWYLTFRRWRRQFPAIFCGSVAGLGSQIPRMRSHRITRQPDGPLAARDRAPGPVTCHVVERAP